MILGFSRWSCACLLVLACASQLLRALLVAMWYVLVSSARLLESKVNIEVLELCSGGELEGYDGKPSIWHFSQPRTRGVRLHGCWVSWSWGRKAWKPEGTRGSYFPESSYKAYTTLRTLPDKGLLFRTFAELYFCHASAVNRLLLQQSMFFLQSGIYMAAWHFQVFKVCHWSELVAAFVVGTAQVIVPPLALLVSLSFWGKGIVHRDIKAPNCLLLLPCGLDERQAVKVSDLSRTVERWERWGSHEQSQAFGSCSVWLCFPKCWKQVWVADVQWCKALHGF